MLKKHSSQTYLVITHVELVTVIAILLELVASYYTCRDSGRACICWSLITCRACRSCKVLHMLFVQQELCTESGVLRVFFVCANLNTGYLFTVKLKYEEYDLGS
ncbi:hypothetical protein VPH35_044176 [Triticum aestivum]